MKNEEKTRVIYCPVTMNPVAYVEPHVHEEFERAVGLKRDETPAQLQQPQTFTAQGPSTSSPNSPFVM